MLVVLHVISNCGPRGRMAVVVAAMMPPPAMVVVVAKPHPNDKRVVPQGEVQAAVLATPAAKKDSRPVHQEDSSAKNDSRPVYQGDISTVVTGIRVVVTLAAAAARVVAAVARRKTTGRSRVSSMRVGSTYMRHQRQTGPSMQQQRAVGNLEESHLQLVLRVRKHLHRCTLFVLQLQSLN